MKPENCRRVMDQRPTTNVKHARESVQLKLFN